MIVVLEWVVFFALLFALVLLVPVALRANGDSPFLLGYCLVIGIALVEAIGDVVADDDQWNELLTHAGMAATVWATALWVRRRHRT